MGIKKRKYSQKFKEEIVQRALSAERILVLGEEYNLSPGFINRYVKSSRVKKKDKQITKKAP